MREVDTRRTPSRITGRPALERRLRAVAVAVHRFGGCRATSREDRAWAARMIDALLDLTREDRRADATAETTPQ